MQNNKLINLLKEIGLTDNEAKTYLALLSLGKTSIQKISRVSEIKRTTVYDIIDSLQQKGLIRIEMEGFKRKFVAESPERLERILDQNQQKFKEHLPDFLSLYNLEGTQNILKYYEGVEGLKNAYQNILDDIKAGEDYMIVSNGQGVFDLYGEWFKDFSERRSKKDLRIRVLVADTNWAQENKKLDQIYNMETRVLPKNTKLQTNMVVTPQKVLINQITQPIIGIVIENKSVIEMQQQIFEILWDSSE